MKYLTIFLVVGTLTTASTLVTNENITINNSNLHEFTTDIKTICDLSNFNETNSFNCEAEINLLLNVSKEKCNPEKYKEELCWIYFGFYKVDYNIYEENFSVKITNETGGIVEEIFYLPYGQPEANTDKETKLYENKEFDSSTGQYYYGARYYDPYKRLFIQPDSIIPNIYDPQQLNIYAFERGNPYKYVDESGHDPVTVTIVTVAFLAYTYGFISSALDTRDFNQAYESATATGIGTTIGATVGVTASSIGTPAIASLFIGGVVGKGTSIGITNLQEGSPFGEGTSQKEELVSGVSSVLASGIGSSFGEGAKEVVELIIKSRIEREFNEEENFYPSNYERDAISSNNNQYYPELYSTNQYPGPDGVIYAYEGNKNKYERGLK